MTQNIVSSTWRRLTGFSAWRLLMGDDGSLQDQPAAAFTLSWPWVVAMSVAAGLALSGLWSLAQLAFGDAAHLPALVAAGAFVAILYRRALISVAKVVSPDDGSSQQLILSLLVVAVVMCFWALEGLNARQEDPMWLRPFQWYNRVLMIAPLWGAWAMILAPKLSRPSAQCEPAAAAFAKGCGPLVASLLVALPLAWSLMYLRFLEIWQLLCVGVTMAAAPALALALGWRCGYTRRTLLAVNVLTQLAFVLAYLASRQMLIPQFYH